jgi:hypothetical protein
MRISILELYASRIFVYQLIPLFSLFKKNYVLKLKLAIMIENNRLGLMMETVERGESQQTPRESNFLWQNS